MGPEEELIKELKETWDKNFLVFNCLRYKNLNIVVIFKFFLGFHIYLNIKIPPANCEGRG